ncbi:MAG: hypothetical protein HYZ11_15530 [Candidatus Tectomicrobia bacterium]|uniref:Uncharacterized protein n=1 Tax=Tectimicrobiota bacterium TaxID=2528274 RepID=A0A932I3D4_UNCTE|nr:hypothetical protein [Candidatus Tectomicrobia bacterium]
MAAGPFEVKSCALIVRMDGLPSAVNLRELRDRTGRCSDKSIYHHTIERLIRPGFDEPEFTNDFAAWAYRSLGDQILAERLANLDPFAASSIESLRADILDILEERLAEIEHLPSVPWGKGFYFMQASIVVFDTGMRIGRPEDILGALRKMTRRSLYFHFVEGRSRHQGPDDFSDWLQAQGELGRRLAGALAGVDVQFFNLRDLKQEMIRRARGVIGGGAEA